MKIYTKTGDGGKTSLYGGKRIPKTDKIIEAIGAVDELNSILGLCASKMNQEYARIFQRIQSELFVIGSILATPQDANAKLKHLQLSKKSVTLLENEIDSFTAKLAPLQHFVLPGGSEQAALVFLARAVCRRCERRLNTVQLSGSSKSLVYTYINRLSDWLFTFARLLNTEAGCAEILWKP
jgi:cob(I)alamin adenosyltransferase